MLKINLIIKITFLVNKYVQFGSNCFSAHNYNLNALRFFTLTNIIFAKLF